MTPEQEYEDQFTLPSRNLRSRSTGSWIDQDEVSEVKRFNDFTTIDWFEDELDVHRQRLLKQKTIRGKATSLKVKLISSTQTWLVLALMGILIGLIASCLNIITAWLSSIRIGHCSNNLYLNKTFCCWGQDDENCPEWQHWSNFGLFNYIAYVLISLVFAYLAAILVKLYAPFAAGSGISEIKCIVSGFVMKGFLGWSTLLIKSVGLPLAISSGLSLGKEGPSVHYAVCVGNSIARTFSSYRKSASKAREFLTATSAAGVAVAFGSPMGGVLFSIEEISTNFQLSTIWKSYVCSLIAVTTLATINPFRTGQLVMFEVTYDTNWHYFEIPLYIVLGVFGGVYGILVSKFNKRVVAFRKKYFTNFAVREVLLLTLLTATISYFNEYLRLDMTESMEILFHECEANFKHELCDDHSNKIKLFTSLLLATVLRMFFTIITYGCKVPAGIFVPSMAAGATFGRALGMIADKIYEQNKDSSIFLTCPTDGRCIIQGTYAFLGAAAALSGITHLTVTVVIIMFELTGALRYIIPTMIVVAITKSINDKWGEGGIADQMIKFNGLPLIDSKEEFIFGTTVASAMSSVTVAIPSGQNEPVLLSQIKAILEKTGYRGYPVILSNDQPKIVGYVVRSDLEYVLANNEGLNEDTPCVFNSNEYSSDIMNMSSLVNKSPLTIHLDTKLEYVLDIFIKLGPRHILVEDAGLLVGSITRKDILRYEYTLHAILHSADRTTSEEHFDAKVWQSMLYFSDSFRRFWGKLIHNDETRYL